MAWVVSCHVPDADLGEIVFYVTNGADGSYSYSAADVPLALRACLSDIAHALDRLAAIYDPPERSD